MMCTTFPSFSSKYIAIFFFDTDFKLYIIAVYLFKFVKRLIKKKKYNNNILLILELREVQGQNLSKMGNTFIK